MLSQCGDVVIPKNGAQVLDKPQMVKLADPHRDGSISLECCVQQRRSVRDFRDQALTENHLGQLLWAAQGVTGTDAKRAVPSAGALYPLELYVAVGKVRSLSAGVYHYRFGSHELVQVAPGHQREKFVDAAWGQDWIATAPVVICIERPMSARPKNMEIVGAVMFSWKQDTPPKA